MRARGFATLDRRSEGQKAPKLDATRREPRHACVACPAKFEGSQDLLGPPRGLEAPSQGSRLEAENGHLYPAISLLVPPCAWKMMR